MNIGVFLTHPIKHFDIRVFEVWGLASLTLIPISFIVYHVMRAKWIENRWTLPKFTNKINTTKNQPWSEGCNFLPFWGNEDDFTGLFIICLGIIAAAFVGLTIGILLLGIEIIISQLFNIDAKPFTQAHWGIYLLNIFTTLYSTYFIAVFITVKFL